MQSVAMTPPLVHQGADAAAEVRQLMLILNNPRILEQYGMALFQRSDVNGDGVLSFQELERLIPQLHAQLSLRVVDMAEARRRLVRARMRRFDVTGDGVLNPAEFLELYRWTLWRKYEDVDPPKFKRVDAIGSVHIGVPSQFYVLGSVLGTGQFGVVNQVTHRQTRLERAMKTIHRGKAEESGSPLALLKQEIELLAMLDHPHILRLFEHYTDTLNVYLVTDLCSGGELQDVVKVHAEKQQPLPESWVRRVFAQTLEAIAYCHAKGVMHKDLKFEHVMFQNRVTCESPIEDIHVVIVDVGLAELFGAQHGRPQRSSDTCGSLCTMAPEVLTRHFSYKCDIWGIGCMLYAIFNVVPTYLPDGKGGQVLYTYPFAPTPGHDDPLGVTSLLQAQRRGPPMDRIASASPGARQLVQWALTCDESVRPSAPECLAMRWFVDDLGDAAIPFSIEQVRAIEQDREHRLWWRAMAVRAATQLPASKLGHLERRFALIDRDKDGTVQQGELASFLMEIGVPQDAAERAAQASDFDENGEIEWSEFVATMLPTSHELFAVSLMVAFQSLDANCDGSLDHGEVLRLLVDGHIDGMHMPAAKTAETMISELDADGSGSVSFAEFHDYFVHSDDYSVQGGSDAKLGFGIA